MKLSILKPDDQALLSVYYCLGYEHGIRYGAQNRSDEIADRELEKILLDVLPREVSELRHGGDPELAANKIKALMLEYKKQKHE